MMGMQEPFFQYIGIRTSDNKKKKFVRLNLDFYA